MPRRKKEFLLDHKLNNYLKKKTLVQNKILQREEPGRHFKMFTESF